MSFQVTPYGAGRVRLCGFADFVDPPLQPPESHSSACRANIVAGASAQGDGGGSDGSGAGVGPLNDGLLSTSERARFRKLLLAYASEVLPSLLVGGGGGGGDHEGSGGSMKPVWSGLRPMAPVSTGCQL